MTTSGKPIGSAAEDRYEATVILHALAASKTPMEDAKLAAKYLASLENVEDEIKRLREALETIARPDEVEFPAPGWQTTVARRALDAR